MRRFSAAFSIAGMAFTHFADRNVGTQAQLIADIARSGVSAWPSMSGYHIRTTITTLREHEPVRRNQSTCEYHES